MGNPLQLHSNTKIPSSQANQQDCIHAETDRRYQPHPALTRGFPTVHRDPPPMARTGGLPRRWPPVLVHHAPRQGGTFVVMNMMLLQVFAFLVLPAVLVYLGLLVWSTGKDQWRR